MKTCKHKKTLLWVANPIRIPIGGFLTVLLLCCLMGCETGPTPEAMRTSPAAGFPVASVQLAGLTQFVDRREENEPQKIRAFVELRDVYDSKLKAPATFRFALYEYVPHRSDPRGKHIQTWPDFRLINPHTNHLYWRDYLRAYEFTLDVRPPVASQRDLLLEVTCTTPQQRRIYAFAVLQTK